MALVHECGIRGTAGLIGVTSTSERGCWTSPVRIRLRRFKEKWPWRHNPRAWISPLASRDISIEGSSVCQKSDGTLPINVPWATRLPSRASFIRRTRIGSPVPVSEVLLPLPHLTGSARRGADRTGDLAAESLNRWKSAPHRDK